MSEQLVEGIDVSRSFQLGGIAFQALKPASFTVHAGDRIAIIGPSGSGKSTLMQLIADLDKPSTGQLRWPALGMSGQLRPRRIGVVFQSPSLIPTLSAIENVEVPMLLLGDDATSRDIALKALASVGLTDMADKLPDQLSGGQAQRVGLARAIALRPQLILADEPTGQLDEATAQKALDALLDAVRGSDAALIVTTHDPAVASRLKTVWKIDFGLLTLPPSFQPSRPSTGSAP